jgi:hypothetical protein
MFGRIRRYIRSVLEADRAAEEREFFAAWDEMGWPDFDPGTGKEIRPTWDQEAKKWVYPDRPER